MNVAFLVRFILQHSRDQVRPDHTAVFNPFFILANSPGFAGKVVDL